MKIVVTNKGDDLVRSFRFGFIELYPGSYHAILVMQRIKELEQNDRNTLKMLLGNDEGTTASENMLYRMRKQRYIKFFPEDVLEELTLIEVDKYWKDRVKRLVSSRAKRIKTIGKHAVFLESNNTYSVVENYERLERNIPNEKLAIECLEKIVVGG